MIEPTFDKDGYPTEETLKTIREWSIKKGDDMTERVEALLEFMCEAWHYEERAKNVRKGIWVFATGGWSGNESLLSAFYESIIWSIVNWHSINLSGGFLVVATRKETEKEIEKLHEKIVKWAWSEKETVA